MEHVRAMGLDGLMGSNFSTTPRYKYPCINGSRYSTSTLKGEGSPVWTSYIQQHVCQLDSSPSTKTECINLDGQWVSDIEKCYFDPYSISLSEYQNNNGKYVLVHSVQPKTGKNSKCGYVGPNPENSEIQCCTKSGGLCSAGITASASGSGVTIGKVGYSKDGQDQYVCNIPIQE